MVTTIDRLIEQVGDNNAQLFRELKGRLKPRNLLLAVGLSFAGQLLLVASFSDQKCSKYVDSVVSRCVAHSWEIDWLQIFQSLYWILSLILFAGGVYLLVTDLTQEQKRGTLNFIRLSPQSSQKIFLGKLFGVPVLVYLAIVLAFPLHLISAGAAGIPLGWMVSLYALVLVGASCFFTVAMLNAMLTTVQYQAIVWSLVSVWIGSSYLGMIFSHLSWYNLTYDHWADWKWFFLPIGNSLGLSTLWLFLTIAVANYWIWQALNRRFNNPDGTLLSKKQSYWLTGSFQVWLLGLYWPFMQNLTDDESLFLGLSSVTILTLFLLLAIAAVASPQRQTLIDWSRYRNRSQPAEGKLLGLPWLWQDLVLGEKSPSLIAIAINLGIITLIWLPFWLLAPTNVSAKLQAIAAWIISANLIFIYALIIQLGLSMKSKKRGIFAGSQVSSVLLFPLLILAALETKTPFLWMFFVFGSAWVFMSEASAIAIVFTLLGQWLALAGLSVALTKQLHHLGASDSKKLLNPG